MFFHADSEESNQNVAAHIQTNFDALKEQQRQN